jgi:pimeloyl-ACP methyl ester carboxylesterase
VTVRAQDWIASGAYLDTPAGRVFFRDEGNGPVILLFHGFPTWSYDWAESAPVIARQYRTITFDFPGYGMSQKHGGVDFSVCAAANVVELLLTHLGIKSAALAIHDFGGIVGQELLDRRQQGKLSFTVDAVHVLNCGIVYAQYSPTRAQKLLALPFVGKLVASQFKKEKLLAGLNAVRGQNKISEHEFDELWTGMSRENGHKLAYRHIQYNAERRVHHARWEKALFTFDGPLQLVWGLADPVSGEHVLDAARGHLGKARIVELPKVGHFPQSEAAADVVAALCGGAQ